MDVLVAEDYEVNRVLIEAIFNNYQIQPTFVHNGEEAVKACMNKRFDMVFMDINMPIMNGEDATLEIRKRGYVDLPIIALTANAIEGDKEHFIALGMNDYLSKPIEIAKFEKLLFNYIEKIKDNSLEDSSVIKKESIDVKSIISVAMNEVGVSEKIILRMLSIFERTLPGMLDDLEEAIENREYTQMFQVAHKMAGAAGSLHLDRIYTLCKEMEQHAHEEKAFTYSASVEEIRDFYRELKEELDNA